MEVWDCGVWSFTGAAEYVPEGFNRSWFVPEPARHAIPGSRQHAIYAVSWKLTASTVQYPLMWDDANNRSVNAYDVSAYYLQEFIHACWTSGCPGCCKCFADTQCWMHT